MALQGQGSKSILRVKEDAEGSGRLFRGAGRMLRRSEMVLMGSRRRLYGQAEC